MHPEIKAILNYSGKGYPILNTVTLQNADRILNYIDDINLERTTKFELTVADSLYLLWNVANWEFHIECLKGGRILYTFRKGTVGKSCGSMPIDEFIIHLQKYLLAAFANQS
jgi:hypothetical protein